MPTAPGTACSEPLCPCGERIVRRGSRGPVPELCEPCRGEADRARQRRSWQVHHERRVEDKRRYRAAHPERTRAQVNAWADRNRETLNASRREQRAANPEPHRERVRLYALAHPKPRRPRKPADRAANRARALAYQRAHPESHAAAQRRRRARLSQVPVAPYRASDIFDRDGWVCQLCRLPVDPSLRRNHRMGATIDHIIPIVNGGADATGNVQLAHFICNIVKGPRRAEAAA